jgi:PAS domain S-box-containing protein
MEKAAVRQKITSGDSTDPTENTPRPHVLLVDDQPARLLTYEAILEGVGVDCVRAHSGKEALEKLLRHSFALILLDVSMPEMDGFETARLIREHHRFEQTPIIFVTGVHVSELDSLRGYEVGAIDYISVPIVPEILRSKVALLVELYRRRAELERLNLDLQSTRERLEAERSKTLATNQLQLRESEERYRTIFEHPLALTVVLEAVRNDTGDIVDWRYVDANANALRALGHSREALLNMRLRDVEPERVEFLMPLCRRVLADREPQRYEMEFGTVDYLMCLFPMGESMVVRSGIDITARIHAEKEERRRSEVDRAEKEWLSAVLNSMNEEVYFTDTQKRYTYVNPAARREFGHESLEGVEVEKVAAGLVILCPNGTPRPVEETPALRSLSGEIIREEEQMVFVPRTGELRHCQVSAAPVRNRTGKIIGSVSVVRDITEKRRADAALRLRDARSTMLLTLADRFRSLNSPGELAFSAAEILGETLAASHCGYGTVDPDTEIVRIERDWRAPGIPSLAGFIHFREYGSYIEDLKRGDTVVCADAERDIRTASTADALKLIGAHAFVNMPIMEHGKVVAVFFVTYASAHEWSEEELAFIRDVAERTRIAVERRRSEQSLSTDLEVTRRLRDLSARLVAEGDVQVLIEEILAAAISITNADGGTLQLLDEATQELTFAATKGLDRELIAHFERVNASSQSSCGRALASGARTWVEFDVPEKEDPDGSLRRHAAFGLRSAQSTPLISRSGRALGMVSTHWRERRTLSDREAQFLDLLSRQAADLIERTRAEEELRRSEHQLRDADRRKDEFIAMLAHELRNPLVPIRTGVELLRRARERPDIIDSVRPMMERQIGHMVRMIDDLLDVSRITSGKLELQRRPVTLSSVIGTAIELNREAIAAGNHEFAVNLPEPRWILNVDPTRFAQVISNLLQNAAKFTPSGGRISLDATIKPEEGENPDELVLKVVDSGEGISAAMLPRIFDLFAQASTTNVGSRTGLGIGLALARRLVEMHGGSIEAKSAGANHGSEFTLRLPAPRSLQPQNEPRARLDQALKGLRVLVVDDNTDAADSVGMLLGAMGCSVQVAYDGLSALAALTDFTAAVVLLDIGMPGMDGYETCRRIREKWGARVVVVAVTGWGQQSDKQSAIQSGFDAHITKPADPTKLERLIYSLSKRIAETIPPPKSQ